MRRGFAAAVAMTVASAVMAPGQAQADALKAARAPERLRATESSQAPGSAQSGQEATSHGLHSVSVKFDYDFGKTPACSATVKKACVQEFVAYDISAGVKNRAKLFEIPLPLKPTGLVPGIRGESPTQLDFESGRHLISVVAREPDGTESKHEACTSWIEIP